MNIAIVEDDLLQRTALHNWLEGAGHHCDSYNSGVDFTKNSHHGDYQLMLFDWELPGMSGIELLTRLRSQLQDNTPVIFITTHNAEEDIVLALRTGADDYLVKPARRQELLARIEALARRSPPTTTRYHHYGNILIDQQRQQLTLNGSGIELTQKEYALACYLMEHLGQLLSRAELLEQVWGHSRNIQTRTLDTHISRLRKKLQLTAEHGWLLGAVYQYGYRLDHMTEDNDLTEQTDSPDR